MIQPIVLLSNEVRHINDTNISLLSYFFNIGVRLSLYFSEHSLVCLSVIFRFLHFSSMKRFKRKQVFCWKETSNRLQLRNKDEASAKGLH